RPERPVVAGRGRAACSGRLGAWGRAGPPGPLIDPGAEQADLLGRERLARPFGRHLVVLVEAGGITDQAALGALARHDRRPAVTPGHRAIFDVQRQAALLFLRAVAAIAVPRQDRRDVAGIVDRPAGRGGERRSRRRLIGSGHAGG